MGGCMNTVTKAHDSSRRIALFLAATLTFTTAVAQQATEKGLIPVDEIIVTGSRIRRQVLESPSPLTVISGDTFSDRGVVNVEDVLLLGAGQRGREKGAQTLRRFFERGRRWQR